MITKNQIHKACLSYVAQNIEMLQDNIRVAQESSQSDTKSSAGDKYETTRAMMQIEIENCSKRLQDAQKQYQILIEMTLHDNPSVGLGSLVLTNKGSFFVSVGIGQLAIEDKKYFIISPQSPIAELLMRKKLGESFVFREIKYEILEIF